MAAKPTFILVPGMWHRPAFFNKLKDQLSKRGFPSVAIDMPSTRPETNNSVFSRQPDVEAVASAANMILDKGDDVVILMHSFGGISGTEAAGRILEETSLRPDGQGRGKIVRLVYVAAFVGSEDEPAPVIQSVVHDYAADFFDVSEGGILTCNQRAKNWFYGDDLALGEQEKHFRLLTSNPIAPFLEPVRYAAWKQIPSTYVYSTEDKAVPYAMMKHMVHRAQEEVFAVEGALVPFDDELGEFHVDVAHCAIFLAPEPVAELGGILSRVAEGTSP